MASRTDAGASILSGIQRRLLVMLLVPLGLLALVSAWVDYRSAGNAALQQDQQLQRLAPLLADSIIAPGKTPLGGPLILLAPPVEEFLKDRSGYSAYAVADVSGRLLLGEAWMLAPTPATREPEFHSGEEGGITYRIVSQRAKTAAGELVVFLADGSDARQQWFYSVLFKVLLPNVVLVVAAAFAVNWAVRRALRPLLELRDAVERRSPRDLSALDASASPDEVRPLVESLNRLFTLVNAQAQAQRRFVADAAHQLRTPLAGLQAQVEAWSQVLNSRNMGKKGVRVSANASSNAITLGADQIFRLQAATRRTSQLANQLLALSRADAQSQAVQPMQCVDLKELCETVLALYLDAAAEKGIDLGLGAAPTQVCGHSWLLRELLVNLLDNAIKYAGCGNSVTIRCGDRDGLPFVEVEDDGPGIPEAERGRALERFYRVPGTGGEGNGLGLAIADEIARVHGGVLCLESGEQGHGLRISLAFTSPRLG